MDSDPLRDYQSAYRSWLVESMWIFGIVVAGLLLFALGAFTSGEAGMGVFLCLLATPFGLIVRDASRSLRSLNKRMLD